MSQNSPSYPQALFCFESTKGQHTQKFSQLSTQQCTALPSASYSWREGFCAFIGIFVLPPAGHLEYLPLRGQEFLALGLHCCLQALPIISNLLMSATRRHAARAVAMGAFGALPLPNFPAPSLPLCSWSPR